MFKHRRNRVLALCAGERRLLVKALLSFRNKLVASGKPAEGVTERLKAENQMEWVGRMNCIRSRAEEIVFSELLYC